MISKESKKKSCPNGASISLMGKAFQALPFLSALLGWDWAFCWTMWTSAPSISPLVSTFFPSSITHLSSLAASQLTQAVSGHEQWQGGRAGFQNSSISRAVAESSLGRKALAGDPQILFWDMLVRRDVFCATNNPFKTAGQGRKGGRYLPQSCWPCWQTSSNCRLEGVKAFLCWKWGGKMDPLQWNDFAVLP